MRSLKGVYGSTQPEHRADAPAITLKKGNKQMWNYLNTHRFGNNKKIFGNKISLCPRFQLSAFIICEGISVVVLLQ